MRVHEVQYVHVWEGGGGKGRGGVHAIRRRNTYVRVGIEGYSVVYFDRIAAFEALCC